MTAKKKLIRNIVILVTAMALLLACYFIVVNWDTEKPKSSVKEGEITYIVSEKISNIDSIHIKNPDFEYDIVLITGSQGDILYKIPSLTNSNVDLDMIETAVFSLLKLAATDVLKKSGQDLSEFGLENYGNYHYTIKKKDGSTSTVITGDKTPDGKGMYCTVFGKSEVYVINIYDATAIMAKPDDYCITSILNIHNAMDVEKFILKKNGEQMMHVEATDSSKDKSGNIIGKVWNLTYPWQEDIDTEKFVSMLNELINIEATGFENNDIKPAFEYEINLSDDDIDYNLNIGKGVSDGKIYLSDGENLYNVNASVWNLVEKINPDKFLLKFVNLVYMDDVSCVTMNYGSREYRMVPQNNGKSYIFCDNEIKESEFKKLYQSIVGMLYTEHTTTMPDSKLYMKLLYELKDGKSETVEFYENDERTFVAIRPNKTQVIVLKSELKTITDMIAEYEKR